MSDASGQSLTVVGAGNMGRALVEGVLRAGLLPASSIRIIDPSETSRTWALSHALEHATDLSTVPPAPSAIVLLAVKPQTLPSLSLASLSCGGLISILAGVTRARLASCLPQGTPILRAMPNLPATLGAGVTAIASDQAHDRTSPLAAFAHALFACVGPVVLRVPESHLDAITALAGSGPAYVFLLASCLQRAGEDLGLSPDVSQNAAIQTIIGAASMLAQKGADANQLMQRVTSPGGTTQAALSVFAAEGFDQIVSRAMHAAHARAGELARA